MGKRNGSLIGIRNVGVGSTASDGFNASGIWGLNDTQRAMGPDNSSTLKSKPIQIHYLLVGGGGGGAGADNSYIRGGGGGGGGVVEGIVFVDSSPAQYNIQVGSGGYAGPRTDPGSSGGSSILSGSNNNKIEAFGGGGGQGHEDFPSTYLSQSNEEWGASGGGMCNTKSGTTSPRPSGYITQGNQGGQLAHSVPEQFSTEGTGAQRSASGGGGAGGSGGDASFTSAGDGGIGKVSYITGSAVYYGGGGGGGAKSGHTAGSGGLGGGGNGARATSLANPGAGVNGSDGQANTGGGGGGAAVDSINVGPSPANGGAGGTGIVILRFPTSVTFTSPGTGSLTYTGPTPIPGTDERYYTFTGGFQGQITFSST